MLRLNMQNPLWSVQQLAWKGSRREPFSLADVFRTVLLDFGYLPVRL